MPSDGKDRVDGLEVKFDQDEPKKQGNGAYKMTLIASVKTEAGKTVKATETAVFEDLSSAPRQLTLPLAGGRSVKTKLLNKLQELLRAQ